jgi:outer membrane lipoprotein-sorting protein
MNNRALLFAIVAFWSALATAESPEEKGHAIAQESDRRNQGYADTVARLTMVLIDADGKTNTREMEVKTLEVAVAGEGDKSLVTFSQPRDVEGTALLTHTHVEKADDQWLYLPALKRVKRISSSNKTGAFMGSEFAYEDLVPQEVEKYRYRFLREEPCGELKCFVVESYPTYEDSGYQRLVTWIDTDEYRPWKVEFYDSSNQLMKTLSARNYKQYLGKYWRPDELLMVNHQNGKSTRLDFKTYQFRAGLHDQDFVQANLQRE